MEKIKLDLLKKHKQQLIDFCCLCDKEVALIATKFIPIVIDFEKYSKKELYLIGYTQSNIQYNTKHFKSFLCDNKYDVEYVNDLLNIFDNYGDLIILAKNKLVETLNSLEVKQLYDYLNENPYSFYNNDNDFTEQLNKKIRKLENEKN